MTKLRTDQTLFATVLAMVAFGLVMVYSSSSAVAVLRYDYEPYHFAIRQLGWAIVGIAAMMLFKRLDYRRLDSAAWAFSSLGLVLAALILVFIVDARQHRWFRISGFGLQPSEFAKPALILFLAYFISRRSQVINGRRTLAQAGLAISVLAALVVVSDLGTAMIPVITAIIVLWVAGLDKKTLTTAMAVGVVLGIVAIASKPYRLDRAISFVDPKFEIVDKVDTAGILRYYTGHVDGSARDTSYQPAQSLIAVASGGVMGNGLMEGKQKLMFLPEAHTDYIYASIGEELGLFGTSAVLFGYLLILWRGARLFVIAREDFGKYLALGVTVAIVVQALINISIILHLAPTKGFPLPMISFGGSSLLSTMICMGMLLSVSEHEG